MDGDTTCHAWRRSWRVNRGRARVRQPERPNPRRRAGHPADHAARGVATSTDASPAKLSRSWCEPTPPALRRPGSGSRRTPDDQAGAGGVRIGVPHTPRLRAESQIEKRVATSSGRTRVVGRLVRCARATARWSAANLAMTWRHRPKFAAPEIEPRPPRTRAPAALSSAVPLQIHTGPQSLPSPLAVRPAAASRTTAD